MQVGIIGLPLSGKTTLFNALTRSQAETSAFGSGRAEVRTAVVLVPDPRVDRLSAMFRPRKTTYARLQVNDVTGAATGEPAKNAGLDRTLLKTLGQCDALVQVVRAFASETVPHPSGGVNPKRDLASLRLELILADLVVVENRIERIQVGLRKRAPNAAALEVELTLMQRLQAALEAERLIADLDLTANEQGNLRGFQFLTAKPALVAVNLAEADPPAPDLAWANHHRSSAALAVKGALEMEIAQLDPAMAAEFLASYGIREPSLNMLLRECYRLLGLMSFFTVGEDEVRAWTVRRGATAVEAAGVIHSDLGRGFIRAEVISYDDMLAAGTLVEARHLGKLRLEGRDYLVRDGDILNIRFNV